MNTPSNPKTVTACVVIIGNEILSGRTQDINLSHIANTLGSWGVQVHEARVIPDVRQTIVDTVNWARNQFDYVFTTGGIGPTHDDITAECIAEAFGVPLIQHPDIAARIQAHPAPEEVMTSRLLMARVPEGASLVDNPTGGPQGFAMDNVYVMAGIPRVMQAMLSTLEGVIEHGSVVSSVSVRAYLGESQIATELGALQEQSPDVDIGSYPFSKDGRYGTVLVVRGTDPARLETVADAIRNLIIKAGETPENVDPS